MGRPQPSLAVMKMIKWLVAALGVIGLGFAVYWFVNAWVQLDRMVTAVHVTNPGMDSPRPEFNAALIFAILGALLLGLGLGLPTQLASRARKQALREVNARVASLDDADTRRPHREDDQRDLDEEPLNDR